jgi:leader peptidase (prepilin peptidase)/N-methyltransferase
VGLVGLHVAYQLAAFAIGAVLGSFAGLAVDRVPLDRSLWSPPSACMACRTPLGWADNVPVVSWVALGGRCRACGTAIPWRYPVIELLGGCLGWLCFRRFVPHPLDVDLPHLMAFGGYLCFVMALVIAALVDVRARIIPEFVSIYAVPVGVALAVALEALGYHGWLAVGWRSAVLGAAVTGGALGFVSWSWYAVTGAEGLAWGDVRLLAMVGAFVGVLPGAWVVVLLASLLGAAVGVASAAVERRSAYLPFGPAVAVSGVIYVLWGDVVVRRLFPTMAGFL